MADLRERLKALVDEWRSAYEWTTGRPAPDRQIRTGNRNVADCADQLAAILAEIQPGCEVCAERESKRDPGKRILEPLTVPLETAYSPWSKERVMPRELQPDQVKNVLDALEDLRRHHDENDGFTLSAQQIESRANLLNGMGVTQHAIAGRVDIVLALIELVKGIMAARKKKDEDAAQKPAPGLPVERPPVAAQRPFLESWIEEAWHDWWKTDERQDGYQDSNGDELAKVLSGAANLPPGASVRFFTGQSNNGQPAIVPLPENGPTEVVLRHVIVLSRYSEEEKFTITSTDVMTEGAQPVPKLGHLQHGQREYRNKGCSFILRLDPKIGPCSLTYFAEADGYIGSPSVTINVGGPKKK